MSAEARAEAAIALFVTMVVLIAATGVASFL